MHQLGLGLQNFVVNNHAYPSWFAGKNSDNPGSWTRQLETGGFDISKPKTNFFTKGVWRCPSTHWSSIMQLRPGEMGHSYSYNAYGVLPKPDHINALGLHGHLVSKSALFAPVSESEVVSPGEMMAIGDSFTAGLTFIRGDLNYFEQAAFASSSRPLQNG